MSEPAGAATFSYTVTATIPVQSLPFSVAVDPTTDTAYVANYGNNSVSVIDGSTDAVVATIPVGRYPGAVAVDPSTDTVYVANIGSDNVSVIDGSTDQVVATTAVGSAPYAVAVDASNDTVYVANLYSASVSVIDGSTDEVVATIGVGSDPGAVAVDPSTDTVYVANTGSDNVSVIDGSSDVGSANIGVGQAPDGVAVDPTTDTVYVANGMSNTVSVIDGSTDTVAATIGVGNDPAGVAVDPSTDTVYVASFDGSSISAIDGSAHDVVANIGVGQAPDGVAVDPSTHTVYVANSSSNSVSVVSSTPQVTTTTTVSSSSNPTTYGQSLTITATVSPSPPSGSITFFSGSSVISGCGGVALRDASGVTEAQCTAPKFPAGSYAITASYSGASGSTDYLASSGVLHGGLVIDPAPLSVTAPSPTTTYGSALPALVPSYAGFVNGDGPASLSAKATCTTSATKSSPVGHYPVTCSGASDPNYTISYVAGTSSVDPAPLSVAANDATRPYGSSNPDFAVSYSGFVLGQDLASSGVSGSPACTTAATSSSPPGTYPITCATGTLVAKNYSFVFVAGTLTVTKAPTVLSATPALMSLSPFGLNLFNLSATLSSEVTGASLAGQPVVFSAGSTVLCRAVTNASGKATCDALADPADVLAMLQANGYTASFAGSIDYLPSATSAPLLGT